MMMQVSDGDNLERDGTDRPRVQSVARALALVMQVAASPDGLTAKELSDLLGLSRQTTYHLLHTLRQAGFLVKSSEHRHQLGMTVGTLAEAFNRQLAPPAHLLSLARQVADRTGEVTYIAGWHLGEVVILGSLPGRHSVRVGELVVGMLGDTHARASGKALLAYALDEARDRYLESHPRDRLTESTITDLGELEVQFERIRNQGYALDLEEFSEGICCISVPLDPDPVTYVMSIACPKDRFLRNRDSYIATMLDVASSEGASTARLRSNLSKVTS